MELVHGRHETSKFEPEDVISNIPDIVITNILDRLPIKDAVRTSVLSRNWRLKWTMLSQLIFDDRFFSYLSKNKIKNSLVLSRILLHLRGDITKFVLTIEEDFFDNVLDDEDINHCILFLSRKGLQDLTLKSRHETRVKLPTHLFSCLELKHLNLHNFSHESFHTFHGFPNLLSLELRVGFEENSELVKLFTSCPLLESLKLYDISYEGKVKLFEIAKLKNLKMLSLSLWLLDDHTNTTSSSTIFKLVCSLPKLQELNLDFEFFELTDNFAKRGYSTAFPCLKTLKLSGMCFDHDTKLSCAFALIRSFPNLQTLEILTCETLLGPSPELEYNTMGPFQLRRVVFKNLNALESEIYLIKCLLACSPFLKRIVVHPRKVLSSAKKLRFAMKLLKLPRASPVAEIDLFHF